MTTKEEVKEKNEKKFLALLCEVQEYLKQNPNHTGTIAKTEGKLGAQLYTLAQIRKGRRTHRVYSESHFQILDKALPNWDNYSLGRLKFEEFCKQLKIYTDAKHSFYDKKQVPLILRDLHVPSECKIGKYDIGKRVSRMKSGHTTLTEDQIEIINKINPQCLAKAPNYDLAKFYIALKAYVDKKDKEYDELNTPNEMRNYSVARDAVVGDYKIGARFRYFRDNWLNLTEAQQECFLKLAPNLLGRQQSKGFDFNKFFIEYSKFIHTKNKYYDKLETPKEFRSYYLHRNQQIFEQPLGEKLYYVQRNYRLTPKQEEALNKLNPKWREKGNAFDFGELYGHFLQFRKQRDAYYDQRNVPQEKRSYTLFSSTYINSYPLGDKMYFVRTQKVAITDIEKEALLKIDPNCFTAPLKAPTMALMRISKKKGSRFEL